MTYEDYVAFRRMAVNVTLTKDFVDSLHGLVDGTGVKHVVFCTTDWEPLSNNVMYYDDRVEDIRPYKDRYESER